MPSILIRILAALLLVWVFQRFLSVLLRNFKKAGSNATPENPANQMVKDPVCGMYMDSRLAVRIERKNEAFYFCSEDCRNKYLNKPPQDGMRSSAAQ